ncbi:hypothetical protein LSH36_478g02023 [Paralvinella palmiformis]|uniref:SH3 domain-containing protein n=1 Tax=Paralvinella palmiformis TaxID=53620 RepID=A0AAD9MWZ6_9ANNE|nr:hypothetical protein LSH36_478g02023 [Paralvinella palmiformis]
MNQLRGLKSHFEQLLGLNHLTAAHRAHTTGELFADDVNAEVPAHEKVVKRRGRRMKHSKNRLSLQALPEIRVTEHFSSENSEFWLVADDYVASNDKELSLTRGQKVEILDNSPGSVSGDLCLVRVVNADESSTGQEGLLPASALKPLPNLRVSSSHDKFDNEESAMASITEGATSHSSSVSLSSNNSTSSSSPANKRRSSFSVISRQYCTLAYLFQHQDYIWLISNNGRCRDPDTDNLDIEPIRMVVTFPKLVTKTGDHFSSRFLKWRKVMEIFIPIDVICLIVDVVKWFANPVRKLSQGKIDKQEKSPVGDSPTAKTGKTDRKGGKFSPFKNQQQQTAAAATTTTTSAITSPTTMADCLHRLPLDEGRGGTEIVCITVVGSLSAAVHAAWFGGDGYDEDQEEDIDDDDDDDLLASISTTQQSDLTCPSTVFGLDEGWKAEDDRSYCIHITLDDVRTPGPRCSSSSLLAHTRTNNIPPPPYIECLRSTCLQFGTVGNVDNVSVDVFSGCLRQNVIDCCEMISASQPLPSTSEVMGRTRKQRKFFKFFTCLSNRSEDFDETITSTSPQPSSTSPVCDVRHGDHNSHVSAKSPKPSSAKPPSQQQQQQQPQQQKVGGPRLLPPWPHSARRLARSQSGESKPSPSTVETIQSQRPSWKVRRRYGTVNTGQNGDHSTMFIYGPASLAYLAITVTNPKLPYFQQNLTKWFIEKPIKWLPQKTDPSLK